MQKFTFGPLSESRSAPGGPTILMARWEGHMTNGSSRSRQLLLWIFAGFKPTSHHHLDIRHGSFSEPNTKKTRQIININKMLSSSFAPSLIFSATNDACIQFQRETRSPPTAASPTSLLSGCWWAPSYNKTKPLILQVSDKTSTYKIHFSPCVYCGQTTITKVKN